MKLNDFLENGSNVQWIISILMGETFLKMANVPSVVVMSRKYAGKAILVDAYGMYMRVSYSANCAESPCVQSADLTMLHHTVG